MKITVSGRTLTVCETVKKLNPDLFGVGEFQPAIVQSNQGRALERRPPSNKASRGRVARSGPVLRITLVSYRRRLITDLSDNGRTGYKGLRDAIAAWFGLDDADSTIEWVYAQQTTKGRPGTNVIIESLV